jgi:hypothetical protein
MQETDMATLCWHFWNLVANETATELMMMMMMSLEWDYICDPRPRTGLLFTSQMIYEPGEPWWNIEMAKLLIRLPELSDSPPSSYLVANQEDVAKEMINVVSRSIFVQTSKGPLTCTVFSAWDRRLFFPFEGRSATDFYRPRPGLNPRTYGQMANTLTIAPPRTRKLHFGRPVFSVDKKLQSK